MADRYDVLTARKSDPNDENSKTYFTKIGVMFKSKDKDAFMLKLSALPLSITNGEATLIIKPPSEQNDAPKPSGNNPYASQRRTQPVVTNNSVMDDDIPF